MREKAFGRSLEGCARGQCADPRQTIPVGTGPATVRGSSPRGLCMYPCCAAPADLCCEAVPGRLHWYTSALL